jgi:hypothetical protein
MSPSMTSLEFGPENDPEKAPLGSNLKIYYDADDNTITKIVQEIPIGETVIFPIEIGPDGEEYIPSFHDFWEDKSLTNTDKEGTFYQIDFEKWKNKLKGNLEYNEDPIDRNFVDFLEDNLSEKEYTQFILEQIAVEINFIKAQGARTYRFRDSLYSSLFNWPDYYPRLSQTEENMKYLPMATEKIRTLYATNKFLDILKNPEGPNSILSIGYDFTDNCFNKEELTLLGKNLDSYFKVSDPDYDEGYARDILPEQDYELYLLTERLFYIYLKNIERKKPIVKGYIYTFIEAWSKKLDFQEGIESSDEKLRGVQRYMSQLIYKEI